MALPYNRMMMPPSLPGGGQQSQSPMAIPFGMEQPPTPTGSEEGTSPYDVLAQLVKLLIPGASAASGMSDALSGFNPAETLRGAARSMPTPQRMGQMGGAMPSVRQQSSVPDVVSELARQISRAQMGPQRPRPMAPQQTAPAQPHFGMEVKPSHFGPMGPQRPAMRTPFDPNKAQQGSTFADEMQAKMPTHESDREREYRMSLNKPRQQPGGGGMNVAKFLLGMPQY